MHQASKFKDDLLKREQVRKCYIDKFNEIDRTIIHFKDYKDFTSNYIFPIVLKDSNSKFRDKVRNKLAEFGIQTSVHYSAVHRFSIYKDFYLELSKTDYVTDGLITLSMYFHLLENDIKFINKTLKAVYL